MNDANLFNIDLHVHTAKYSECAESLDPTRLGEFMAGTNINGVVITEHDTLWNETDFTNLKKQSGDVLLFNGIEVTTECGCHIVIIGIDKIGPLQKGIRCDEAVSYARENGAVSILAHPFRNGLPSMKIIASFDAIEIGSTSLYKTEASLSLHLAESLNKPCIASSDAHALTMVGWAYTNFPERPENILHLCAMIREGRGTPVIPHPFFA